MGLRLCVEAICAEEILTCCCVLCMENEAGWGNQNQHHSHQNRQHRNYGEYSRAPQSNGQTAYQDQQYYHGVNTPAPASAPVAAFDYPAPSTAEFNQDDQMERINTNGFDVFLPVTKRTAPAQRGNRPSSTVIMTHGLGNNNPRVKSHSNDEWLQNVMIPSSQLAGTSYIAYTSRGRLLPLLSD